MDESKTTLGSAWDMAKLSAMTYGVFSIYGAIATGGLVGGIGGLLGNAGIGVDEFLGDLAEGTKWVASHIGEAAAPALDTVPQIV